MVYTIHAALPAKLLFSPSAHEKLLVAEKQTFLQKVVFCISECDLRWKDTACIRWTSWCYTG